MICTVLYCARNDKKKKKKDERLEKENMENKEARLNMGWADII